MKAPRKPESDPKQDAASALGMPDQSDADPRVKGLDALFGDQGALGRRPDEEVAASRAKLAELFGQPAKPTTDSSRAPADDLPHDVDAFFTPPPPEPEKDVEPATAEQDDLTDLFELDGPPAVSEADAEDVEIAPDDDTDMRAPVAATAVLVSAAPTAVLAPARSGSAPVDPASVPVGSFLPAPRRGVFAWSTRVRWSVAASVVLLAAVVAGVVIAAQMLAANNQAAQALAAAADRLEAAELNASQPYALMEAAFADYEAAVLGARAAADSAGPALAAVAGMTDEDALAAANAALAALVAQLDGTTPAAPPGAYERGVVDVTDLDEIAAATQTANNHAERVATATREARAAQAALDAKVTALTAAQGALGSSLPATAVVIVGENPQAVQSFRDAVIATSVAVPAAQATGASGDAELLAYAAAVTMLRADQVRAETDRTPIPVTPPASEPDPAPAPEPLPPDPLPTPVPTETVVPIPPEPPVP